jgi:hypothetical protein
MESRCRFGQRKRQPCPDDVRDWSRVKGTLARAGSATGLGEQEKLVAPSSLAPASRPVSRVRSRDAVTEISMERDCAGGRPHCSRPATWTGTSSLTPAQGPVTTVRFAGTTCAPAPPESPHRSARNRRTPRAPVTRATDERLKQARPSPTIRGNTCKPGLRRNGGPRNRTWRCGFGDHRVTDTPVPHGAAQSSGRERGPGSRPASPPDPCGASGVNH